MIDIRIAATLAAAAQCDVRTARDYLGGRDPRGYMLRARLDDARRSLGVEREGAPPPDLNPPPPSAA